MVTWAEARRGPEQRAAVAEALRVSGGNVTEAARLLGIGRQYLHRLLAGPFGASVARGDSGDTVAEGDADGHVETVARTLSKPLTYRRQAPTLGVNMSTAPLMVEDAKITMELPKPMKDWLEKKALERKQRNGGRMAVSPILVELIEREMAAEGRAKDGGER